VTAPLSREDWLNAAIAALRPLFSARGYTVPDKVRVSCGWTSKGSRGTRIGECWPSESSKDGAFEVFISPKIDAQLDVVAILVHELVHPTVGLKEKHNRRFKKCATAMNLTGKMTATVPDEQFTANVLNPVLAKIGVPYPHGALSHNPLSKTQTTRMLKCECKDCGYTVRTTAKWLDEVGAPLCPCNEERMEVK
jgi:hypothetical protein